MEERSGDASLPRYRLGAGVELVARGRDLQIGVLPGRGVVLAGAPERAGQILRALDGESRPEQLLGDGDDPEWWREALRELHAAGLLSSTGRLPGLADERVALTRRVGAEQAELALVRRQDAVVEVIGQGRTAALLGETLLSAGIGRVCDGPGPAQLPATVTVLAADRPLDPLAGHELVAGRHPHLAVHTGGGRVVVGPLVLPGRSACLWCLELHRAEADPWWPEVRRAIAAAAGGATALTAAAAAGWAASEVLLHVDGTHRPLTLDGTVEWDGAGLPRRRSWSPHPRCACRGGPPTPDGTI